MIEQKTKAKDTIAALGATSNASNDGKTDESIKRKELCSQLSQYCVAKQAASKFQVCYVTFQGQWVYKNIVSRKLLYFLTNHYSFT